VKYKSKSASLFLERRIKDTEEKRETVTETRAGRNVQTYRQERDIS